MPYDELQGREARDSATENLAEDNVVYRNVERLSETVKKKAGISWTAVQNEQNRTIQTNCGKVFYYLWGKM